LNGRGGYSNEKTVVGNGLKEWLVVRNSPKDVLLKMKLM